MLITVLFVVAKIFKQRFKILTNLTLQNNFERLYNFHRTVCTKNSYIVVT
jgi:hypothetical protein